MELNLILEELKQFGMIKICDFHIEKDKFLSNGSFQPEQFFVICQSVSQPQTANRKSYRELILCKQLRSGISDASKCLYEDLHFGLINGITYDDINYDIFKISQHIDFNINKMYEIYYNICRNLMQNNCLNDNHVQSENVLSSSLSLSLIANSRSYCVLSYGRFCSSQHMHNLTLANLDDLTPCLDLINKMKHNQIGMCTRFYLKLNQ